MIFGIGAALEAASVRLAMLFVGRVITGVGEGLFLSTLVV
jgi:predicted MFS family arabinose efflux permease